MGIVLTANNSEYAFYMGYGGFFRLRKTIAEALDTELGAIYAEPTVFVPEEQVEEKNRRAEQVINTKHLDDNYADVLDFLYMSDIEGKISYKTCRKIADLLIPHLPSLQGHNFVYSAYAQDDYQEFVNFLHECYSHRRNMYWK